MRTFLREMKVFAAMLLSALLVVALPASAQQGSYLSLVAGRRLASLYAFGFGKVPGAFVVNGNTSTGAQTITICTAYVALPDGRTINILGGLAGNAAVPITIDPQNSAVTETVTPTAVSLVNPPQGVNTNQSLQCANVTATFANLHGPSNNDHQVISGDAGIQEALNDAQRYGGGIVTLDSNWQGTNANLTSAIPFANVSIEDARGGSPQYWTPSPLAATLLAAPTTLIAATAGFGVAGANFTGGSYTGSSSYVTCIAYVDILGQEGPCSATFTIATSGSATTDQIGFTTPAASTGAVGYTIYISLAGGTYNLSYQVPLTSTVCALTKLETTTPACAVTNATYNQTGSAAIVSALTVNTAPLHLLATTASTTAAYIGTPNGRTTYGYAAHNSTGVAGVPSVSSAFTIATAAATTVPSVIGTINVPAGFMNQVGRTVRLCGSAIMASTGSTSTIEKIQFLWDGAGSNTAGAPVIVGNLTVTATDGASAQVVYTFCGNMQTTVAGSGVTAGSIFPFGGYLNITTGTAGTPLGSGNDPTAAAVGSLNLAGTGGNTSRIHVVYLHTTGTDAAGVTLNNLTIEAL